MHVTSLETMCEKVEVRLGERGETQIEEDLDVCVCVQQHVPELSCQGKPAVWPYVKQGWM